MSILTQDVSPEEVQRLLALEETHFVGFKSRQIAPSKLTRTIAALANADGGDVYVGICHDKDANTASWLGFDNVEAANGHIQIFEELFPLGDGYAYTLLHCKDHLGLVLHVEVSKSKTIKTASDKIVYVRRNAQNLPVRDEEALAVLRRAKGITSFETETLSCDISVILESETTRNFMRDVVPTSSAVAWMKKQQVILADRPTVAVRSSLPMNHKQFCQNVPE